MTGYSSKNNRPEKQALPNWVVASAIGLIVLILAVVSYQKFIAPERAAENKATLMRADSYRNAYSNPPQGAAGNPGTPAPAGR